MIGSLFEILMTFEVVEMEKMPRQEALYQFLYIPVVKIPTYLNELDP